MRDCLFCRIVEGREQAWITSETDEFIAFLTPFPNTPGFTVIATKTHMPSYVFELETEVFHRLLDFARTTAKKLDKALGTHRTGMIIEGMGVNHTHIKLVPMHGLPKEWEAVRSNTPTFTDVYQGSLTSNDGPRMDDAELSRIQAIILQAE